MIVCLVQFQLHPIGSFGLSCCFSLSRWLAALHVNRAAHQMLSIGVGGTEQALDAFAKTMIDVLYTL
jgi:hypothetical protein